MFFVFVNSINPLIRFAQLFMSPLFFLLTALGAVHYYFASTADFHYTHQFEVLNSCNMRTLSYRINGLLCLSLSPLRHYQQGLCWIHLRRFWLISSTLGAINKNTDVMLSRSIFVSRWFHLPLTIGKREFGHRITSNRH